MTKFIKFYQIIFHQILQNLCKIFANFWRARSRLYQNEILQVNMRSTTFFKLYKICILLHPCNLNILAKNRFENSVIFVKFEFSAKILQMLQNLQNIAKFRNFQLDNLVDFEKCCKTHIYLQKSVPIQPKTSENLPKLGNYRARRPGKTSVAEKVMN